MQEYRRFLWLVVTQPSSMTPADAVDQAWHLHITDTVHYREFCQSNFGYLIEHAPSRGALGERAGFERDYRRTLRKYLETFGEPPPSDIWPCTDERFLDSRYTRVSAASHWTIPKPLWLQRLSARDSGSALRTFLFTGMSLLATLGCAVAGGNGSASLSGPDFLGVYCVLWAVCLLAATALRRGWFAPVTLDSLPDLDPYEVAELVQPGRGLDVAVSNLVALGRIQVDSTLHTFASLAPPGRSSASFETKVHQAIANTPGITLRQLARAVSEATAGVRGRLKTLGLVSKQSTRIALGLALLAPFVGVVRAVTSDAGRPVSSLVVLCVLGAIVAFVGFRVRTARTPRGDALVKELQHRHWELREPIASDAVGSFSQLPMAVGLFGTGLLVAPTFAAWANERGRNPSSETGGCSSGGNWDSDASSGSGDSGDSGGGDGGGGCSGCGGCGGGGD